MSIKNIAIACVASIGLSGISFIVSDSGMCATRRSDGSVCQRITGGKAACDNLDGKWDAEKNCCQIDG